jgi:hypothetical protein
MGRVRCKELVFDLRNLILPVLNYLNDNKALSNVLLLKKYLHLIIVASRCTYEKYVDREVESRGLHKVV